MSSESDEIEALAALLGRGAAGAAGVERAGAAPMAWPRPSRDARVHTAASWRLPAAIVGSLVPVLVLPAAADTLGRWTPFWQAAAVAVVLVAVAWLAARTVGMLPLGWGARPVRALACGLAMGAIGIGGCVFALYAGGRLVPDGIGARWGMLVGLAAVALQVAGEEVFFRGWLQPALGRLVRPSLAIAGSAMLFSTLHLVGGTRAWLCLVNLLLAGVLFGLFAWRSGGLAMPFAVHVAWNAGETLVFGLYPNPGSGPWGTIRGYDIVGPALWGGGEEGLNDSVIVTLVLGALVLAGLGAPRGQLA